MLIRGREGGPIFGSAYVPMEQFVHQTSATANIQYFATGTKEFFCVYAYLGDGGTVFMRCHGSGYSGLLYVV